MNDESPRIRVKAVFPGDDFQKFLDTLAAKGYGIIGPTVRDGQLLLDEIIQVQDLPIGITDEQDKGIFRLKERGDKLIFGYVLGQHSWKKYLYPPRQELCATHRTRTSWKASVVESEAPLNAFLGVRPCEIAAIQRLDGALLEGEFADPGYAARRANSLIIAVNCGTPGGSCFCVSMGTGPKAAAGFDLALTEVLEGDSHFFVVEIGSTVGAEIAESLGWREATEREAAVAASVSERAAGMMGRSVETAGVKELLYRHAENSIWNSIAKRCLTCGNCTMVCPTCFCSTVEDYTDLQGKEAVRVRKLDSCYTMDYSYIHGGSVRYSAGARYRQWLTHKFASWQDQFGAMGCVGCGRCITWCPAGIDVTEEIRAIQENEAKLSAAAAL